MQWDKISALSIPEDYRACLRVLALDKVSEVFVADLPDLEEAAAGPNIRFRDLQIFRRLVLGWIDSYDSNQILIFSGFSRSTKLSG